MTRRSLSACVGLLALTMAAPSYAADLPRPSYKAPIYVAPIFTWTGFYAGINGGYGWSDSFADDAKGGVFGGQLGYNWQAGNFVFGIEGDIQGTTIKATETVGAATVEGKVEAFATVRGRLGYAFDRMLIYGTGGWAYTKTDLSLTVGGATISDSDWSSGYAIGGGLEWAIWDRWSLKGEYLYVHSGDTTLTLAGTTVTGDFKYNIIRAGLNYRF